MLFSPFHPLSECSDENPCEGLSRHATFDNFGMAFLTLFRVSTGDNWNGIMKVIFLSTMSMSVSVHMSVSQSIGYETGNKKREDRSFYDRQRAADM